MNHASTGHRRGPSCSRFSYRPHGWIALVLILAAGLPSACTRFFPAASHRDMAAAQMVAALKLTNGDLTRFQCVGKITLSGPNLPTQSFRAAISGQLPDRLRIDMFAPFGGSAGTVSSDGEHLFLVIPPSREYYKKRLGRGSLEDMVQIDVTVGDLLEILVGRIPIHDEYTARLAAADNETQPQLILVDGWGMVRQRISVDDFMQPVASVWFDARQRPIYRLTINGTRTTDGFALPKRIELSGASGKRISLTMDRYAANVRIDEGIFIPAPPPS